MYHEIKHVTEFFCTFALNSLLSLGPCTISHSIFSLGCELMNEFFYTWELIIALMLYILWNISTVNFEKWTNKVQRILWRYATGFLLALNPEFPINDTGLLKWTVHFQTFVVTEAPLYSHGSTPDTWWPVLELRQPETYGSLLLMA